MTLDLAEDYLAQAIGSACAPNPLAPWELRAGALRVYYDVEEPARKVLIRAIGIKERERVRIGGKEFEL